MSGTVNISRDLWHDEAFRDDEFSQREAWVWLIAEASWKPRTRRIGSHVVELERGQLAGSVRFFAERWKWSPARVFRYFDMLENRNMIKRSAGTQTTVITICKYNEYQPQARSDETQSEQKPKHRRNTGETNEKKGEIRGKERDTVDTSVSTAADAPEVDLAKAMFDQGVKLLASAGTPQAKARSLLGKWRRDHGEEAVIVALGRAQREGAIDPVGFVEGALRFRQTQGARASPTIGERRTLQSGMVQEWAGASEGWQEVRC